MRYITVIVPYINEDFDTTYSVFEAASDQEALIKVFNFVAGPLDEEDEIALERGIDEDIEGLLSDFHAEGGDEVVFVFNINTNTQIYGDDNNVHREQI